MKQKTVLPHSQNAPERTLADLENEQASLRVRIDAEQAHLSTLQREFALKLSAQRAMLAARIPLAQTENTTKNAVNTAQEALSRHIGQNTESVYAEALYKAEQAYKAAQEELATFDQQHSDISAEQLANDRTAIQVVQQSIEQAIEQSRTLSTTIVAAAEQQIYTALTRVLTGYQDLYSVLEADGPIMARLRTHDPVLFNKLMPDLALDQMQLWECLQPYIDHDEDFRPFLRERQAAMQAYLGTISTKKGE